MSKLIRIVSAALLLGLVAFCVFGFLAAAEMPDTAGLFQFLYGAIGLALLGTAGWLVWPRHVGSAG